jgi:RNA ligase (TIGR02306 family)
MSSLIVPVAEIEKLSPHCNADTLELAQVLGWQVVVKKDQYQVGDRIVYFPIDTVLPLEISERFSVTNYLSKQRIKCAKLRGEPSFGLVVKPDCAEWQLGENVADYYGASKYLPPVRMSSGDSEEDHPLFWKYTDIENMRNYPTIFQYGEQVILSEKIHGTNCRVGLIEDQFMAGSKEIRRKQPENYASNIYWYPLSLEPVQNLLKTFGQEHKQVILFGEVYGSKIQSFHYGLNGILGFRAFDLLIDGNYISWPEFGKICKIFGIEMVPIIATIPFDLRKIKQLSEGKTLLMEEDNAHIREGLVVRPIIERNDPKIDRVILKYVSDSYLFDKKTDFTEK